jgi:hypothetical protein
MHFTALLALLTIFLTRIAALPDPASPSTSTPFPLGSLNTTLSPRSEDQILCYTDSPQMSLVDTNIWWHFYLIVDHRTEHTLAFGECVEQSYEGVISHMCGGDPAASSTYSTDEWARRYEACRGYIT